MAKMAARNAFERSKEMNQITYEQESPAAKRKQLEEAGLSVGLMYGGTGGMGGAGSATTQAQGQGAGGQQGKARQSTSAELQMAQTQEKALGIQMAKMAAETRLNDAMASKATAETTKISGVDTQSAEANIESITTGTKGQELKNAMQELQNDMAKETRPWVIQQQVSETLKAGFEAIEAQVGSEVAGATKEAKIQALINNVALQGAEYALKKSQIELTDENRKKAAASIEQEWNRIAIQELEQKKQRTSTRTDR